jgi:hypothetical protein
MLSVQGLWSPDWLYTQGHMVTLTIHGRRHSDSNPDGSITAGLPERFRHCHLARGSRSLEGSIPSPSTISVRHCRAYGFGSLAQR